MECPISLAGGVNLFLWAFHFNSACFNTLLSVPDFISSESLQQIQHQDKSLL